MVVAQPLEHSSLDSRTPLGDLFFSPTGRIIRHRYHVHTSCVRHEPCANEYPTVTWRFDSCITSNARLFLFFWQPPLQELCPDNPAPIMPGHGCLFGRASVGITSRTGTTAYAHVSAPFRHGRHLSAGADNSSSDTLHLTVAMP